MAVTRQDVESLSAALGDPAWLTAKRLEAWKWFESFDLPSERSDEGWRHTELRRLKFRPESFDLVRLGSEGPPPADGVICTDLQTALSEHSDLIQPYLFEDGGAEKGYFRALAAALFSTGTFLYVPEGVAVQTPIETRTRAREGAGFARHVVVLAEGASAEWRLSIDSETPGESLFGCSVEISVGPGARLDAVTVGEPSGETWHVQTQRAAVGANATFRTLSVALGGRLSRWEVETSMKGEHSEVEMLGLYFAEGGQHFDFRTLQEHAAPGCRSDLLFKGALRDESRSVYAGLIRVAEGAAGTDAYQANRNLVLSDHAKADSQPELEILNNDVRCTHGASVGQVNPDELFYLQTRGLARAEAERLIVEGFFQEVVSRASSADIQAFLSRAVERKLK